MRNYYALIRKIEYRLDYLYESDDFEKDLNKIVKLLYVLKHLVLKEKRPSGKGLSQLNLFIQEELYKIN